MIRRNFRLTPAQDSAIAVLLVNAEVEKLGELASYPRYSKPIIVEGEYGPFCKLPYKRKLSAIEILQKAQQRASDRMMRELEKEGWH